MGMFVNLVMGGSDVGLVPALALNYHSYKYVNLI